jgi:hypothetical protein
MTNFSELMWSSALNLELRKRQAAPSSCSCDFEILPREENVKVNTRRQMRRITKAYAQTNDEIIKRVIKKT